ncbi:uncharacterized protein LOC143299450 isoform X2 [Babylonia areolata]|uniref:uncharacterized protein LOC143299450 isoform X2 n=1 Tax=Babylonia areolata TaxID=304850 RepID=UPI003FD28219
MEEEREGQTQGGEEEEGAPPQQQQPQPPPQPPTSDDRQAAATQACDSDNEQKIKMDEASSEKQQQLPSSNQPMTEAENENENPSLPAAEEGGEGQSARKTPEEMPGSSRPHSSTSSARAKSSGSGEIIFEAKKKKKRGGSAAPDDAYTVTFTVSIAMAIPTVEDEDQPDLKDLLKKKKRVFEAPRAQNYYHVEYYLIPEDDELMKTDIVTYGMAAKLYMERHDARVIKTWQDGDVTWIAWAHSHTMTVTKEMLLKMFNHTLELRVWDTKDKCSTRARFDRPKAFRLPQPKPGESPEDVGGVKAMVMKQMAGFSKMQSPKAEPVRPLPQRCAFPRADTKKRAATATATGKQAGPEGQTSGKALVAVAKKSSSKGSGRTFSRLGKLAGAERPVQSPGGKDSKTSKASLASSSDQHNTLLTPKPPPPASSANSAKSGAGPSPSPLQSRSHLRSGESEATLALKDMILPEDSATVRRRQKKAEAAAAAAAEQAKKFGVCVVPFRMALLFSGMQTITSRLQQPVNGVEDLFITVSLDQPLLSEEQKRALNPMIITVKSVTNMPSHPMAFEELRSKCQPVYCKYQFFRQPAHTTVAKEHAKNIHWDDKNVVLLGPQEPSELREYLSGPAMTVEVHDRDRKTEDVKLKATLFGDDLEDEKISNVGTVASRRTLHNAFEGRNKPWDPYGVSRVDLSELLLGLRFMELTVPIHNCPLPDLLGLEPGARSQLMGVAGAVDGPVDRPLSSGGYMASGATLKIQVELAHPIITPQQLATKEELESTPQCPFGRIVFLFDYKNTTLLYRVQQLIMTINARALDLDDMPQHVIDAALSTYKLSIEQQTSGTLDIVTGFHVLDGVKHIFVLEGLRDHAIKQLWEELPTPENSDVRVLYNSDLSFGQRLYGPLDVDLCRVKLHEPLELVVRQSLLYVRDMVPRPCFLALIRLEEMTRMHLMKDLVKNDMFPTSDMVVSMSKEFGVPFTAEDFEELRPEWEKSPEPVRVETVTETPGVMTQTGREWTPIDNFNKAFVDKMAQRKEKGPVHDFISENKEVVKRTSDVNVLLKEKTRVPEVQADVSTAHNYSTQALNSTELANQALRTVLQEQEDTRFTRSQDFQHSGTVVPVDVDDLAKEEVRRSKELWRTPTGWIYPGRRSMIESNVHPKRPSTARVDELKERWLENLLHVSELQPTLDRERFPWDYRQLDLNLYSKPSPLFKEEPLSIHLPGVQRAAEKAEAQQKEAAEWQSRLVVKDPDVHVHRVLPNTEMTDAGFYSSNQIDRLTCLLKDSPQKISLKLTNVRDIPPLGVVNYPAVDTVGRARGLSLKPAIPGEGQDKVPGYKPGPYTLRSWNMEDNRVPAYVYDHRKHAGQHGKDFNTIHKERQQLWKRSIVPLSDTERENHLFQTPLTSLNQYQPLPAVGVTTREMLGSMDAATSTQDLPPSMVHERGLVYV